MAFSHDQRNPMAIRFPEEKGMECLVDIQLNMLKYFVVSQMTVEDNKMKDWLKSSLWQLSDHHGTP